MKVLTTVRDREPVIFASRCRYSHVVVRFNPRKRPRNCFVVRRIIGRSILWILILRDRLAVLGEIEGLCLLAGWYKIKTGVTMAFYQGNPLV